MEIAPIPQRLPAGERRRLLIGLLVLVPVLLLVLLPALLGVDRFVVTDDSMAGSVGRGSVALAREVPPGELDVGDVVTFRPPGMPGDKPVTRRIVAIDGNQVRTRGDARPQVDPWTLHLSEPAYHRMLFHVPWVGYPFTGGMGSGGWMLLAAAAAAALAIALLSQWRRERSRPVPREAARAARRADRRRPLPPRVRHQLVQRGRHHVGV